MTDLALESLPADGLGLSVDAARTALRVSAMVAAACATAAAILGYQVMQRSRSARVALSVLAVPLVALYEVSLIAIWFTERKRNRENAKAGEVPAP